MRGGRSLHGVKESGFRGFSVPDLGFILGFRGHWNQVLRAIFCWVSIRIVTWGECEGVGSEQMWEGLGFKV